MMLGRKTILPLLLGPAIFSGDFWSTSIRSSFKNGSTAASDGCYLHHQDAEGGEPVLRTEKRPKKIAKNIQGEFGQVPGTPGTKKCSKNSRKFGSW